MADNKDKLRTQLEGEIAALKTERAAMTEQSDKDAATKAIAALRNRIDLLDVQATDDFAAAIESIVGDLEEVMGDIETDAVAAIKRTVKRLRDSVDS